MGFLDNIIPVTINAPLTAPQALGFGTGLLISTSTSATWTTQEKTRVYLSAPAVAVDFPAGSVEAIYANQYFGQPKVPLSLIVGRLSVLPQMMSNVGVVTPINATVYGFRIGGCTPAGAVIPTTQIEVTSADNVNDNIVTLLVNAVTAAALSGVTAASTGAGGSHVCAITGTAGSWVWVELFDNAGVDFGPQQGARNLLSLSSTGAEPATAYLTQIDAMSAENDTWFEALNPNFSATVIADIAAGLPSRKKMMIQQTPDTAVASHTLSGGSDIGTTLFNLGSPNISLVYHPHPVECLDAAMMGNYLPTTPGKATLFYKTLNNVTATKLSGTEFTNLDAKAVGWYYSVAGKKLSEEGKVSSGGFHAAQRNLYYAANQIQTDQLTLLANSDQVDLSPDGLVVLENQLRLTLDQTLVKNHVIQPGYTIIPPTFLGIPVGERQQGFADGFTVNGFLIIGIKRVAFTLNLSL